MRSRGWLVLAMVALPALAAAQTVKEADLIGGWRAEAEREVEGTSPAWLVFWPDGLWWFTGRFMRWAHGGARWRLGGDTLWLANDFFPYFHPMIGWRLRAMQRKGHGVGIIDMEVINKRPPYPVPDSIYWSKAFRDTTKLCASGGRCVTGVYKVSKQGQQIHLVRLDSLSTRVTQREAIRAVLTRDTLANSCDPVQGC